MKRLLNVLKPGIELNVSRYTFSTHDERKKLPDWLPVSDDFGPISIETHAPRDAEERNARLECIYSLIERNPEKWTQRKWHCGTAHCIAGWAQVMAYNIPEDAHFIREGMYLTNGEERYLDTELDGKIYLGLTNWQGELLFRSENTMGMIRDIIDKIKAKPYDREQVANGPYYG